MLDKFLQNAIEDAGATGRLREMIGVLRKREVVRGMTPVKLRQVLEDLGPTFVKLGQIMSMRPDFLPPEYCDELMKLQSGAKPLPFPVILEVIEKEYNRRWNQVFKSIDEEALGSASIAQVHRAVLASGEKVVIKVQRPGIYEIMSKDIVLLKRAATLLKIVSHTQDVLDFGMILDEMWTIAKQEMDFLMEADHIEEFEHLNRDVDYVGCPKVSFVEIFAKSLSLDFKKNFSWRAEMDKMRREGLLLMRKSAQLPEQISDILKMTMSGQTKVNLDLTGAEEPLRHLDRMINKIIIAVLCAALLLGSSTICTTNMTPKIMEIPLLGFLGYLIAFVLSIRLIWEIHKGA